MRILSLILMLSIVFRVSANGQFPILVTDVSLRLVPTELNEDSTSVAVVIDHAHDVNHGSGAPLLATLGSWTYGVCSVDTELAITNLEIGNDLIGSNGGNPPAFHSLSIEAGGFTQSVVVNLSGLNALSPGTDQELAVAHYSLQTPAQLVEEATIEFCDSLGQPQLPTVFYAGNISDVCIIPQQESAHISVQFFRRGDVDDSGNRNIVDVVNLLGYLFQGASLPCQMAADCDADGSVNIGDALVLLGSLFGSPAASLPHPFNTCGFGIAPCDSDLACP